MKTTFLVHNIESPKEEYIHVADKIIRCPTPHCRGILARGDIPRDPIELKCPKCKNLIKLQRLEATKK